MENQIDQATDKATETQTVQAEVSQVTETPTMADVAKKYQVDKLSTEFTAKPTQPAQMHQTYTPYVPPVPDPVTNPDEWNRYQATQGQYVQNTLREFSQTVSQIARENQQARLDQEVNKAVSKVNEKLKIDPTYTEILLEKRYRDDPIFRSIWDNRSYNPKALEEALEVISNEARGVFQIKTDPQLQENIRAAKQSTQTKLTNNQKSDDPTAGMSEAEFDRWWFQQKRGY